MRLASVEGGHPGSWQSQPEATRKRRCKLSTALVIPSQAVHSAGDEVREQ